MDETGALAPAQAAHAINTLLRIKTASEEGDDRDEGDDFWDAPAEVGAVLRSARAQARSSSTHVPAAAAASSSGPAAKSPTPSESQQALSSLQGLTRVRAATLNHARARIE